MRIQPAVQEIENLVDMISVSTHRNNRVFAEEFSQEVASPYTIGRLYPTLDERDVVKYEATFGP